MARRAGIPEKNKAFLNNRLKAMYGDDFEPVMKMAQNAVVLQEITDRHIEELKDIPSHEQLALTVESIKDSLPLGILSLNTQRPS